MNIQPIVLCGGTGSRLWPVSRKSFPKQFGRLIGAESLYQRSLKRVEGDGLLPPLVVTNDQYRFIAKEQAGAINSSLTEIILEPEARNTAGAILAGVLVAQNADPKACVLTLPSDHLFSDNANFLNTVKIAAKEAESGNIITFGVPPKYPETGYGYLELGQPTSREMTVADLASFVEKPDKAKAERMLASGNYLWNSGIFLFSIKTIIQAFKQFAPDILKSVSEAISSSHRDLDFLRLAKAEWSRVPNVSIDYAIMEKANNLKVASFPGGWSDVGSWPAVAETQVTDEDGNTISHNVLQLECTDSMLRSENDKLQLVGIGLDSIIAVATDDAILIMDKSKGQDVKTAVEALERMKIPQAERFPYDYRPWGYFESLSNGENYHVKKIVVYPGQALSLQSHNFRSEHWVVVAGTARVTINDTVRDIEENQSVYIPVKSKHRLENKGKTELALIEVQTGSYFGEDDIIRYEDRYSRD